MARAGGRRGAALSGRRALRPSPGTADDGLAVHPNVGTITPPRAPEPTIALPVAHVPLTGPWARTRHHRIATPVDSASRAWARQAEGVQVDVAIVGAGGAGLSLVTALDRLLSRGSGGPGGSGAPTVPPLTVALVDPVHRRANDRTWCFWDDGPGDVEEAVHRAWNRVAVVGTDGRQRVLDLGGLRYVMVRSADFYAMADDAAARIGAVRVPSPVDAVEDGDEYATVHADGLQVRARWVFDSRPAAPVLRGNTTLLQHFRGWTVRFGHDALDPDLPTLMDFSVPQPDRAVAFCYVLPSDWRRGLVEYTQFSRSVLPSPEYDAHLQAYLLDRWGTGGASGTFAVEDVEDGVIPMTDAVFARRAGRRVMRLGTAGGATRPSTGYTFAAMQRQASSVAAALLAGRDPVPPAPHSGRHRWMDAVLLRAIDSGAVRGADLFTRLFDRNPADRVLRFLDGGTGVSSDVALMRTAPVAAMTGATFADATARARRRLTPR